MCPRLLGHPVYKAQFCLVSVLTPLKLLGAQKSNLERLITCPGECLKGVLDVTMTSKSQIIFLIAFLVKGKRF